MDDYLSKPFTEQQIEAVLVRWLGKAAATADEPASGTTPDGPPAFSGATADVPQRDERQVVDLKVLDKLHAIRPDMAERVTRLFLEHATRTLQEIDEVVAAGDVAALGAKAHSLKSSSANVGAAELAALFARLEIEAREKQAAKCPATVAEIRQEFDRVVGALASYDPTRSSATETPASGRVA